MTKMKTKRGAAKRFSLTGAGKIKRSKAYHRHFMRNQSQRAKVAGRKSAIVTAGDAKLVKRMLPYLD
jgi:large subunit ribosomal protein L35